MKLINKSINQSNSSSNSNNTSNNKNQANINAALIRLDLSKHNIAALENLDTFACLSHLIVSHNELTSLYGVEKNKQLWRLEVNGNKLKSLDGLSRFLSIGTLNLYGNDLTWSELEKIRHLHIIDLCMINNPKLEKDPNYRYHLVDCLPNAWMIDGLLVTTSERQEVVNFFEESAKTLKPVRRKLAKVQFVPTDLKKRDVFGDWATKLLTKFPVYETKNIETDLRRLEFMCVWFEDIVFNELKEYTREKDHLQIEYEIPELKESFLKDLLDYRKSNTEMCNMILVLLIASVQFRIPYAFMKEMLIFTNLHRINDTYDSINLFSLPCNCRIYIASLLLSAAKVDRDQNMEGGIYENLFTSLKALLVESIILVNESDSKFIIDFDINSVSQSSIALKDCITLLSTEIIQLFCIVPSFYEHLTSHEGLKTILKLSIIDANIYEAVQSILNENSNQKKPINQISEELGSFITNLLKLNVRQLMKKKTKQKLTRFNANLANAYENSNNYATNPPTDRSNTSELAINNLLSTSKMSKTNSNTKFIERNNSPVNNNSFKPKVEGLKRQPNIGELLIIGKKTVGKIVKIEKPDTVLVKFENSKKPNDIGTDTLSICVKSFEWDSLRRFWRPESSTGDINTFAYNGDVRELTSKKSTLSFKAPSSIGMDQNKAPIQSIISTNIATTSMTDMDGSQKETVNDLDRSVSVKTFEKKTQTDEHSSQFYNSYVNDQKIEPMTDSSQIANTHHSVVSKSVNFSIDAIRQRAKSKSASSIIVIPSGTQLEVNRAKVIHVNKLTKLYRSSIIKRENGPMVSNKFSNMENLTTIGQNQNSHNQHHQTGSTHHQQSVNYEFVQKWAENESVLAESKLIDNTQLSFEELDRVPSAKVEFKRIDVNGFIPQNSVDNQSFQSNQPTSYEHNFNFIEPMNESLANKITINDDPDETDYDYMGNASQIKNVSPVVPTITVTHHQILKPHLNSNRVSNSSKCSKHTVNNHMSLNDLSPPAKSILKASNITCIKCLSNLHEQHQQDSQLPMGRPTSPNHFSILRRDKKSNKITQEMLDEYQDIHYYINYEDQLVNGKKKKFIKIQDCTDWLEFKSNQKQSNNNSVKTSINSNNSASVYRHYSANIHKINLHPQSNSFIFQNTNNNNNYNVNNSSNASDLNVNLDISQQNLYRINILLNRRSARASTHPKKPILTSPSSKAHIMCKGLRPSSLIEDQIQLTSKKLPINAKI